MNLSQLPKELEDIIIDYKSQLEHKEKFQKTLNTIKSLNISYLVLGEIQRPTLKRYICNYQIQDNNEFLNSISKDIMIKNIYKNITQPISYFDFFDNYN